MILIYGYIIYWAVAAVGITYGYHRYFAHRTFKANTLTETLMCIWDCYVEVGVL